MTDVLDESFVRIKPADGLPPPSPFLPGTEIQYAWDSTSLGYLKTCPRLYQLVMLEGWSPNEDSVHLRFGAEYHSALEQYDHARAAGSNHTDARRHAIAYLLQQTWDNREIDPDTGFDVFNTGQPALPNLDTKHTRYKNRHTLVGLVVDYLDKFGPEDPAETYRLANGKPAVELSFRFELDFGPRSGDGSPYLLCGHLDRVVDFNGQLLVMDRKTSTSTLSPHYFNQYEPSNQMTLYTLAGKIVMQALIRGVVIDAAQIKLEEPNEFRRGFTYRTEAQLSEWLTDLQILLNLAETYAEVNHWPMNDTACDKFGGCRFRGICSKSPEVREKFLRSDFVKKEIEDRWNPMKPR